MVGSEILDDLSVQREALERTRSRMEDTGEDLQRSRGVLRRLRFTILQNKFVLVAIIIVEILVLAYIVYLKFVRKRS